MKQAVPNILKSGQHYMEVWPMQKVLYGLFPECRIVAATKFGFKVMPALAVITVATQLFYLGTQHLPQALTFGIFFLSLPVQGLIWLGLRAEKPLPPEMKAWYQEVYRKMQEQGCALEGIKSKPRFLELALLLKTAFNELDKGFTKQFF
ncbi:DUF412 domain-containing protein [Glaciecola sp. MH2013]|uniref:terminus macrodomain insulation protein YfbV n=1 Tax=Glaciecola sp. MH2013 TaxID=2785524 RepID=UPI0018A05364|nr:terminus macrodomain insulation protein YfbV [Glaciecola sp. MH2013]MBF7072584.1 DUF412 domain-containing protein [Glaciecola sp. MH2013]